MPKKATPLPKRVSIRAKVETGKTLKQKAAIQKVHKVWHDASRIAESTLEHAAGSGHTFGVSLSLGLMIASLVSIGLCAEKEGVPIDDMAEQMLTVALKSYHKNTAILTH